MNIHEYQAKNLLRRYGIPVPSGGVAYTSKEAQTVARELPGQVWVVKSQIHAGGRGAGKFKNTPDGAAGIRSAHSIGEVADHAAGMIGQILVTRQTGPEGKEVKRVYIEEGCQVKRELYCAMLVDRTSSSLTVIASSQGGMDIEEVAANSPDKIISLKVDPLVGLRSFHCRTLAYALGLQGKQLSAAAELLRGLYRLFTDQDCSLIEINPLVVTARDTLIALDAKVSFDDNALFRHKDIEELRDESEMDPTEFEAEKADLNYIKLGGNIGCMVNGAGLAMATMDIVKLYGGEPANFLDVGGSAPRERVATAFKLILSDVNVETILVNIFGGIMRCDIIAEGVVAAAREVSLHVPLVVRLEGTNVALGRKLLNESGLSIVSAETLADAAEQAVRAAQGDR